MAGPTARRSLALRRRARAGLLSVAIALLASPAASDAGLAAETTPLPEANDPLGDAGTIDGRIREIETAIARDETVLKAWVAQRGEEDRAETFAASPELREIASRLPRLQSELRSLRQQRSALESP